MLNFDEEKLLKQVGQRILELREKANLTQQELATDSDIPKNQIGRIERAEINTTVGTLGKIATALNITLGELLNIPNE